jgi:NitT/TauT family transport system substrate-binding protein
VLVVSEDAIKNRRADVQRLVDGIARSGKWLDQTMDHRMEAAQFVAKNYYSQDPRLLTFVLSKPPDRVKYTKLTPLRKDFEEIEALAVESGIMQGTVHFEDYVDDSFVKEESTLQPYAWEGGTNLTAVSPSPAR